MERLGVGNAIPSERQLSVDLGVSRLTVRAALDELVREGYLVRRRGSGTFVREPKIAQELTMTSFSEDMRRRGMRPGKQDALAHRDHAPGRISAAACTSRRRSGSSSSSGSGSRTARRWRSRPCTCASRSCPGSRRTDLEEHSFYELLAERYGIVTVGGIQTIEPTVTNEEESTALGVPLHSPAFLFERTTRSESDEIVEFVRSIYRGDRYRLVTELSRRDRGRRGAGVRAPRRGLMSALPAPGARAGRRCS